MSMKMKVIRYDTNPFLEGMVVPVRGQKVQLSRIGKDDNVLVSSKSMKFCKFLKLLLTYTIFSDNMVM